MTNENSDTNTSFEKSKQIVELDIAPRALFKVALATILGFLLIHLFPIFLLIFLALLISVSLEPVIKKLEHRGISHRLSVAVVALGMITFLALIAFFLIPAAYNQITALIKDYPSIRKGILDSIPNDGFYKHFMNQILENPKIPTTEELISSALVVSNYVFKGITEFFLVITFSIYLLFDGEKAYRWFKDFFSASVRSKIQKTSVEMSEVILGYVTGQAITSVLGFLYVYIILYLLNVPGALTLALIAGLLDVLPVLGFVIAVVPAMILALTVSPVVSLYVLGLYILYHILENYLIVPYIYGSRLEVSSLVVLLALLIAGTLGGVVGAIAILPLVASYPIIEKNWLVPYLGRQVVEKHATETEPAK